MDPFSFGEIDEKVLNIRILKKLHNTNLVVCSRHNLPTESGNAHEPMYTDCSFGFVGDAKKMSLAAYKVYFYQSQRVLVIHVRKRIGEVLIVK